MFLSLTTRHIWRDVVWFRFRRYWLFCFHNLRLRLGRGGCSSRRFNWFLLEYNLLWDFSHLINCHMFLSFRGWHIWWNTQTFLIFWWFFNLYLSLNWFHLFNRLSLLLLLKLPFRGSRGSSKNHLLGYLSHLFYSHVLLSLWRWNIWRNMICFCLFWWLFLLRSFCSRASFRNFHSFLLLFKFLLLLLKFLLLYNQVLIFLFFLKFSLNFFSFSLFLLFVLIF